eukprot:5874030-Pleurochrysis_carterae.AAC.1
MHNNEKAAVPHWTTSPRKHASTRTCTRAYATRILRMQMSVRMHRFLRRSMCTKTRPRAALRATPQRRHVALTSG